MIGHNSGFAALVKKRVPDVLTIRCTIHRHVLASETATLLARGFNRDSAGWKFYSGKGFKLPLV